MKFDINELTIGQAKKIVEALSLSSENKKQQHPFVGKFVIAICYAAGVHAGEVVDVDGENVMLKNSLRLWNWR